VRANNGEAFLGKDPHQRRQQPVIARKRGPSDSGQNLCTLKIWTEMGQSWPFHWPDQDQVLHAMLAQQGQNTTRGAQPSVGVGIPTDHRGVREAFEGNDENRPSRRVGGGRNLAGKWPPTRQNAKRATRLKFFV
jgi:hypothetical protein